MTVQPDDEHPVKSNRREGRNPLTLAAIIGATVIIVISILACAGTAIVLIYNLPF
jgi:hypothetical protein